MATPKSPQHGRPPINDRVRLNLDIPSELAADLKMIATERVGVSVSEFVRMQLSSIISAYLEKSEDGWAVDDSNPSREVIDKIANLYEGRPKEFQEFALRRLRREMVLYLEAEKTIKAWEAKQTESPKRRK
jgi:hypothetical protein